MTKMIVLRERGGQRLRGILGDDVRRDGMAGGSGAVLAAEDRLLAHDSGGGHGEGRGASCVACDVATVSEPPLSSQSSLTLR